MNLSNNVLIRDEILCAWHQKRVRIIPAFESGCQDRLKSKNISEQKWENLL